MIVVPVPITSPPLVVSAVTNADVMTQILSEASGKPEAEVRDSLTRFCKVNASVSDNSSARLSDTDAERLLSSLRRELPGIREWLAQGDRRARRSMGF